MPIDPGTATLGAAAIMGAGSYLSSSGTKNQVKRQMTRRIRDTVKDAKLAGIHPLYALGAGGGASSITGSPAGEGLLALGQGLSQYGAITQRQQEARDRKQTAQDQNAIAGQEQSRLNERFQMEKLVNESVINRNNQAARYDQTLAAEAVSRMARAAQSVNATGAGRANTLNELMEGSWGPGMENVPGQQYLKTKKGGALMTLPETKTRNPSNPSQGSGPSAPFVRRVKIKGRPGQGYIDVELPDQDLGESEIAMAVRWAQHEMNKAATAIAKKKFEIMRDYWIARKNNGTNAEYYLKKLKNLYNAPGKRRMKNSRYQR